MIALTEKKLYMSLGKAEVPGHGMVKAEVPPPEKTSKSQKGQTSASVGPSGDLLFDDPVAEAEALDALGPEITQMRLQGLSMEDMAFQISIAMFKKHIYKAYHTYGRIEDILKQDAAEIAQLKKKVAELEHQASNLQAGITSAENDSASAYSKWQKCKNLLYTALHKVDELQARVDSLGAEKAKVVGELEASQVLLESSRKLVRDMKEKQDALVEERVKTELEESIKHYKNSIGWELEVQQAVEDYRNSRPFYEFL